MMRIYNLALSLLPLLPLAITPFLLGGNREWAWAGLAVLVGFIGLVSIKPDRQLFKYLRLPLILFGLAFGWGIIQTLPVFPSLYGERLAIDRWATWQRLLKLASYLAVFLITLQWCRQYSARIFLKYLVYIMILYAGYGLFLYFIGNNITGFYQKTAYLTDLTGTFVNRNSWATFMGLGVLCTLTHALIRYEKIQYYNQYNRYRDVVFHRKLWLGYLGLLIIPAALLLTHSRAGVLISMLAATFLLFSYLKQQGVRFLWLVPAAVLVFMVLLGVSNQTLLGRILSTSLSVESRPKVWAMSVEILKDRSLTGIGLGNFETWFLLYKTEVTGHYHKLHNDWFENIIELGLPAALCLFSAIGLTVWRCFKNSLKSRQPLYGLLAVAASLLVGLHSLVDFSLQIPAVSYWYAAILAIGYSRCLPKSVKQQL